MKIYIYFFCFLTIHESVFGWFEYQRALSALESNDLESASQLMGAALLDKPFDPARLYDAGVIAYKKGDFKQALDYFATSSEQAGTNEKLLEKVHFNAGNAEFKLNELEKAIEQYELTLAINPDNEQALANKKMVEELLEKKREQEEQENQENDSEDQNEEDENQEDSQNKQKNKDGKGNKSKDDTGQEDDQADDDDQEKDDDGSDEDDPDEQDSDNKQQKESGKSKKRSQDNQNKNHQSRKDEDPFKDFDKNDEKDQDEAHRKDDNKNSELPQESVPGQQNQTGSDDSGAQQALNAEDVDKEVREFLARQQEGLKEVDPMLQEISQSQENRDKELNKALMQRIVGDKGKRNAKQLW